MLSDKIQHHHCLRSNINIDDNWRRNNFFQKFARSVSMKSDAELNFFLFYIIRLDIIKMLFEIGDEPVELNTTFTVTMRIDTSTGSKQESMLISILFCPY